MTTLFKPIRPKKISEEIVGQIKELISQGQLKPGERIPSERDLATMLGVSRPSVREAVMVLEAMGLLDSRQGGGTYVRSLTAASLADPLFSMLENNPRMLHALAEVRMGLESWSAFLAAKRANEQDIARIRDILGEMERQSSRGGWDPEVDARFHYAITTASHNTVQQHVLNTIHGLFQTTIAVALTEFYKKEGYIELLLSHHRSIYEAIARKDAEGARQEMLTHLALVEDKMSEILKEHPELG